ncbi:methyltransferase [Streptosporangium canum]|uniref:methyltransferase n=1 Tax=Streptosporangium canum TaxID=324952 RepID=UPI0036888F3E
MTSATPPLPRRSPRARHVDLLSKGRGRERVQQILNGISAFGALLVVAELRIADHLADGPRKVTELARLCEADAGYLRQILRVASSLGLLRTTNQPDTYTLTAEGRSLRSDLDDSMLPATLMAATPFWMQAMCALPETVRRAEPALPQPTYEYLADNPDARALFDWFMHTRTAPVAQAIARLDFQQARKVVDVGGGHGVILAKILQTHPHLTGILLERPDVAESAAIYMAKLGLQDRCEVIAGDFLDSVPAGGDLYLMASVLHNWDDENAGRVLRNVRQAMDAERAGPAQAWCVDLLRPVVSVQVGAPPTAVLTTVRMLSLFRGGHERTRAEYETLLAANGLTVTQAERLPGDMHLMIAAVPPAEDASEMPQHRPAAAQSTGRPFPGGAS